MTVASRTQPDQEALLRILERLDTFEGWSRFTTWANKIALRIALTELRRQRWGDVSLESLVDPSGTGVFGGAPETTERAAEQSEALVLVGRMLDEELTNRQRDALTAVAIHGDSMEVAADGTSVRPPPSHESSRIEPLRSLRRTVAHSTTTLEASGTSSGVRWTAPSRIRA